jgi:hypothetical protein
LQKSEPSESIVSIDKEYFLFQKYIEIFYSKNKKVRLLKIFEFPCILHAALLLETLRVMYIAGNIYYVHDEKKTLLIDYSVQLQTCFFR